jgi:membrane fusion protein (multidrug efflux system)
MTPVRRRLRSPPGDAAFAASLFLCCLLLGSAVPAPAAPGLQPGRLLAQLVPREFATLSAEVAGRIEHIGAREGEPFRRGDRLFTIDCDRERAQRARAEAQRTLARVAHEGNQHLARLDAVGSVELAETAAQLAVAEAEIRYLDVTLRKCEVTAPWDGVAGAWHVRPLEYVQAGQPVLDIHDPDGCRSSSSCRQPGCRG